MTDENRCARRRRALILAVGWTFLGLAGCASPAPRASAPKAREVILSSDEDLEAEVEIGRQAARQVQQEMGLLADTALVSYVQEIGKRVAAMSPRTDVEYQFQVADTPDVNAFALPGGYIYVTRGLLAMTNSEDELANVLAHEVGHVAGRHFAQRQERARNVGMLTTVGILAAAVMGAGEAASLLAGLTQTAGAGYLAAYGRDQEREADSLGQLMASRAGWDPAGMSSFLTTLDRETQLQRGAPPKSSFLATHPATPERVGVTAARARSLETNLLTAPPIKRPDYLERLRGLVVGEDPAQGLFREETFLHRDFDLRIEFPKGWITRNTAAAVGALSPNQAALLKLELQGEGADVRGAAAEFMATLKGRVVRKNGMSIGGLSAYRAVIMEGESAVEITWFTHRDLIFRLTGVTEAPRYPDRYERLFGDTASSVRPLKPEESQDIRRLTLGMAKAREGETLAEFCERTGNRWTLDETATANGIFAYDPLSAGQLLKIAVAEDPKAPEAAKPKATEPERATPKRDGYGATSGAGS